MRARNTSLGFLVDYDADTRLFVALMFVTASERWRSRRNVGT